MAVPITPGTRLGRYEIDELIGAGGMGEVYRARDPVLDREVAIKVVSSGEVDADRLARFETEMRAAAGTTDANILAVHDCGVADGVPYLVTELLHGETLREHLRFGPVPPRKFFSYATQILRGLEAAHRRGLAHLDLKPENVFVTASGAIKILDFGIAQWTRPPAGTSEDVVETITASPPVVAGTLSYMAPEQVSGERIDHRADLFAFGVVCYEMLSGHAVFTRNTTSETVRAILSEDPLPPLPGAVPAAGIAVLSRCLEKNPNDRFQVAGDVRLALEAVWSADATHATPKNPLPARLAVVGVVLLALAVAAFNFRSSTSPGIGPALRLSVSAPVATTAGLGAAISNDGTLLVMAATDQAGATRLWIRSLTDGSSRELPGTDGATFPFWSSDDGAIGFFAANKLKIIPVDGGPPRTLCDAPLGRGGTWAGDTIVFAAGSETGLSRVRVTDGEVVQVTTPNASESSHRFPSFMADGRHFSYVVMGNREGDGAVMFASLDRPDRARLLMDSGAAHAWGHDDVLLFVRSGAVWAQRVDRETGTLAGSPVGIVPAIQRARIFGGPTFSVARSGVLAYQPSVTTSSDLVWRNRRGDLLEAVGLSGEFVSMALAPDQHAVAVTLVEPQSNHPPRVHSFDLTRRVLTAIGPADVQSLGAAWSPDSQQLAFASNVLGQNDLHVARVAQPAARQLLVKVGALEIRPDSWPVEGRVLYSSTMPGPASPVSVWSLSLGDSPPIPTVVAGPGHVDARLSPSGRWLTMTSVETGRRAQVIAQSFPEPVTRVQVSVSGGGTARWRKDGRELYFVNANRQLMAVDVDERAGRFGVPHTLFDTFPGESGGSLVLYDVSADGQRFLMVRPPLEASVPAMTVIVNWPSLLKR